MTRRFVSACFCWRDAFFCQRTTSARKRCAWKLRTTISKPSSRLWRGTKHVFALPVLGQGVSGSASNESPNQVPWPWSWQSNCTSPGPTEFANFKISGNIMLIVIFGHMAPSSCVRTKLTRPVHSAHHVKIRTEKRSKSAFVDLRHRCRNVCKWTVVRVEKQAARCRQIGSFPWWRWQTILETARLWTPVTLPFLDGSS